MAVELERQMSVEEFDKWTLTVDHNYEFVGGEVIEVVSHSYASYVAARLLVRIGSYVEAHQLGYFTGADGGYHVGEERYIPDVGFISNQRHPQPPAETSINLPPDLAVEVVSPTDKERALRVKVTNYLAAGTTVWVVYPDEKRIYIHRPNQVVEIVNENQTISNEPTLPGFVLTVADLFHQKQNEP